MNYFWSNTIWYMLLGISTISTVIYSISKAKRRKFAFAFYMTLVGLVLFFETMILIVFKSYNYYPMIIHTSPFDDVLAGNLFSQFSVAATALLVAVLNLKNYWILILSGIYGLIEELFLALGIYSHNWYRTWMTLVGLIIYFWWAKKNYIKGLVRGIKPLRLYFYIFMGLFPLDVITLLWGFILSGYQNYTRNLIPDSVRSPYLASFLYYTFVTIIIISIYFLRLKWRWKSGVILAIYGINFIAYKLHILYFYNMFWYVVFSTISIFSIYLSIVLLDYFYKDK
ncbi:hypothetical protein [Desulfosporosinus hippei]|uniref:Uncharacterized protein n=1 Tax=Desulfosporosinus hippei DSM 8344 TaxID=1121419 RepID=A0A1G8J4H0_9FIRM|nr:hypothetical protein [Desulfosporosinus hippei]SDI26188.1 hypothetical protein SAMN05443529_13121 [Desulfosporosinus hippei DSM 8344]